ncbi:helix-turn-helix transcriptional regulator [Candidatus Aerophobetes bacterium]|nr:helix-turn-helix transcriptional regulator [Candidatus Aerophobetes bacterium]
MTTKEREFLRILGERIRGFRTGKKMTQSRLADKSGLHTVSLSSIERGIANPSILTLRNIAKALEITLPELVSIDEDTLSIWEGESELAEILIKCKKLSDKNRKTVVETVRVMVEEMGG